MAELWYGRLEKDDRVRIKSARTVKELIDYMFKCLKDANYKSYYQRYAYVPDEQAIWIDFGSHSWFYFITKCKNCPDFKNYIPAQNS